jgi:hypothetical protein
MIKGIERAALAIAYDNGMINRSEPEIDFLWNVVGYIVGVKHPNKKSWQKIDKWLLELSDYDLNTLCCGEYEAAQIILICAPKGTDELLAAIGNL